MSFYSHPANPQKNTDAVLLLDHLTMVAKRADDMVSDTLFSNKDAVYCAGLFHDIGKLNPYYQKQFDPTSQMGKHGAQANYDDFHSPYSSWIAQKILAKYNASFNIDWALMLIYRHHGSMTNKPGRYEGNNVEKSRTTKHILIQNWCDFTKILSNHPAFACFDLDVTLESRHNIKQEDQLTAIKSDNPLEDFLELGFLFSALLWADKGFFSNSKQKEYNLGPIDTSKTKNDSDLKEYRTAFQKKVSETLDVSRPINIISAPTGIGKTNAFLDAIKKYKPKRVFYFSPLLALTNDFESKITKMEVDTSQILTYNHVYSGMLSDKNQNVQNPDTDENFGIFDHESFNEPFIITTMHRLLLTLYSNHNRDKLKLASFKNALLIIDEIQTLPKFLIDNMCRMFDIMAKKIGTKVIMCSATIPHELSGISAITMDEKDKTSYLKTRNRKIIHTDFDPAKIGSGRNLVMLNTRQNALECFDQLSKISDSNVLYITSGITKNRQNEILEQVKESNDIILVSTQVIEAGVDISFSNIWRQMAPLDNIVQILGRLDRENKNQSSTLYIFDTKKHNPYSKLEYTISQKYLQDIDDSSKLYDVLPRYYQEISNQNKTQKNTSEKLENLIKSLDFEEVWKMVSPYLSDGYYDSVYVPDYDTWDSVHADLTSKNKSEIKKHAGIMASLPRSRYTLKDYFDKGLFEQNTLLVKKDKIDDLYDKVIGLDKWKKQ